MVLLNQKKARKQLLEEIGSERNSIEEVMAYCDNPFDPAAMPSPPVFPMREEGHLEDWRSYVANQKDDPFCFLQTRLPQLNIPIRSGISQTIMYADVVLRGKPFDQKVFDGKLILERPDLLQIFIHENPVGALPVLLSSHRADFESLVCALAFRNEPRKINPSVNAQMVSGFINWDRVRRHENFWREKQGKSANEPTWKLEMKRVAMMEKWRFYDRFIVIGSHPYSGVLAAKLGLDWDEKTWLEKSTIFRLEHEFTHYATKRLYGKMNSNLLDEIICDWVGSIATMGIFDAKWFLRFLGLEDWPEVRESSRIHVYCKELKGDSFRLLGDLVVKAAEGLETISRNNYEEKKRYHFIVALTRLTLELLACKDRESFFLQAYQEAGRLIESK